MKLNHENKCFYKIVLLKFVGFVPFVSLKENKYMRLLLSFAFFFIGFNVLCQIESGKVSNQTVKKARQINTFSPTASMLYFGTGLNYSTRTLLENKAPFGKPIGTRENEEALRVWTFQMGYKEQLAQHVLLDVGLHLDKYGETYSYQSPVSDSAFSYTNKYSFIGIPIQLQVTFGKRFVYFISGGIQPMLATRYAVNQKNTDADKNVTTANYTSLAALSGFTCNLLLSTGVQFRFNQQVGIYFQPTYSHGLINTYESQAAYKHYTRGFNFKAGLVFYLVD